MLSKFDMPPPPDPPQDAGPKSEQVFVFPCPAKKIKKIRFWDALYNPETLKPFSRQDLIDGIRNGDIVGLNDPDRVVSTGEEVDMELLPSQWALRRDDHELADIIDHYAAIERSVPFNIIEWLADPNYFASHHNSSQQPVQDSFIARIYKKIDGISKEKKE